MLAGCGDSSPSQAPPAHVSAQEEHEVATNRKYQDEKEAVEGNAAASRCYRDMQAGEPCP
jgi:predicted small lipoprotein YifL